MKGIRRAVVWECECGLTFSTKEEAKEHYDEMESIKKNAPRVVTIGGPFSRHKTIGEWMDVKGISK